MYRMRRRKCFATILLGMLIVAIGLLLNDYFTNRAAIDAYFQVQMGRGLSEAESRLNMKRVESFGGYEKRSTIHQVHSDFWYAESRPAFYSDGRYLVVINYDPTTVSQAVHSKKLIKIEYQWSKRIADAVR